MKPFATPEAGLPSLAEVMRERDAIPVSFVADAVQVVRARGYDVASLLRSAGINPAALDDPRSIVSPVQFTALWRCTVELLQDELFGLDPRGMRPGSYTLLCHAVLHSPTLKRALTRALRFFGVILSDFDGRLVRAGDRAEIVLMEKGPARPRLAYGAVWVLIQGLACWLVDTRIPLLLSDFRGPPPPCPDHYRRLFCDNLHFDQPSTRIQFDAAYLDLRPKRTEVQMRAFLRDAPQGFLTQYRNRDSLSARIWRVLRENAPEEWPHFEAVADRFCMTPSTLRRRLRDECVSYQALKDRVRRERAIALLKSNGGSNADIAAQLGFDDPSTFYRAFRKWTGATPNEFRRGGPLS